MRSFTLRLAPLAAAAAWMSLVSVPAMAEMHATQEFEAGTTRPVAIALLPAHVQLVKQRMIRREVEVEESGVLERNLTDAIRSELEAKGYRVRVLTPADVNADPELQALVVDANQRFDELLANVSSRLRKQIESRRYHAGETMTILADKLGVDAVGFTRMQIVAAAKGVQALNFGMGGAQTMMSVSLVDGTTTDIEAYVTLPLMRRGKAFGGYDDIMKDPDVEMANYAQATLHDLLDAEPSLRASAPEGDVLSDIESLLAE